MKTRSVKLHKVTVLELACRFFQANRAVAGLSEFHWPGLLRYYDPERVAEMRSFIERIRGLLPPDAACNERTTPPPYLSLDLQPSWRYRIFMEITGPLMILVRTCLSGLRFRWSFTCQELAWMLNRLEAFLQLLGLPAMPGYPQLISLRNELDACHDFIRYRCAGLDELEKVYFVEYFNKSSFVETIPLSAIIKPGQRSAA